MIISGANIRKRRQEIGLSQAKLAELAKVPQHLLSAYELEKSFLDNENLYAIQTVLSQINGEQVKSIKKKRYQTHSFNKFSKDFSRISKCNLTEENQRYVSYLNDLEKIRETPSKSGK